MTAEAEARKTLIASSKNVLEDIVFELDSSVNFPLTGVDLEDITKKLYRITGTLKTAQSLSVV